MSSINVPRLTGSTGRRGRPGFLLVGIGNSATSPWHFSQYITPAPHSRTHKAPQRSQYFNSTLTMLFPSSSRLRLIHSSRKLKLPVLPNPSSLALHFRHGCALCTKRSREHESPLPAALTLKNKSPASISATLFAETKRRARFSYDDLPGAFTLTCSGLFSFVNRAEFKEISFGLAFALMFARDSSNF
jgi:hypothetical protein